MSKNIHILGIRHHGPGSARNVKAFLENLQPDIVLVEGPPEADAILEWADNPDLKPPVAILCFQPDNVKQAVFYPFAEFSPEWQAIQYAKNKHIPVRFMDLPVAHSFGMEEQAHSTPAAAETDTEPLADKAEEPVIEALVEMEVAHNQRHDPLGHLAGAAGFANGEKWWEQTFETRLDNVQVFDAVGEAMTEVRKAYPGRHDRGEQLREAYMRKIIRQAEREMFTNIAVICGAWHVPALASMPKQKEDNELLKGLPKTKLECTWIPWNYSRLGYFSGYGAGINSPGWYHHVWNHPTDDGTRWMAKVAKLFREQNMDTSTAHIIEAVRLANALAALRHVSRPGLDELNEATLSVLCNGEPVMMRLIEEKLTVSERTGEVPAAIPRPPLQSDIEKLQKRLRLPPNAEAKEYMLDLRKENDLERSVFLHRLLLLGIPWGHKSLVSGKGTFKEAWRLQWDPGFSISIIEKGNLGNTLEEAVVNEVKQACETAQTLRPVCELLEQAIPADLTKAASTLALKINNLAAASNDVLELVNVLPGLVNIIRYGNVRKTDGDMVRQIVESMLTRISIGLPAACTGIDEEQANTLTDQCVSVHHSIQLLQDNTKAAQWQQCLQQIVHNGQAAAMMRGFAARQLMDYKILQSEELYQVFYSSLSRSVAPAEAAAWLEGFLKGSGTVLLLDAALWQMVNDWVSQLEEDNFKEILPLLRRTFSAFTPAERRKLGEKVKHGTAGGGTSTHEKNILFDEERGKRGIQVVMGMLGKTQII